MDRKLIAETFGKIQLEICEGLETLDGKGKFSTDQWDRPGGGGGRSRVLREGNLIEKGGVNFSEVHGDCSPQLQKQLGKDADHFYATGVSIVLHPESPLVPIIHMNIRYFELSDGTHWFGGGIDLTPHYIDRDEARTFHSKLKTVCDQFDGAYYPRFKDWADDYFFIPHRNETRGIGGIFFDDLGRDEADTEHYFDFTCAVGRTFVEAYSAVAQPKRDLAYTSEQLEWQQLRRGRYVEFNLVHDRGTRFGLLSNGRTESILMSLPASAGWEYMHTPEPGSAEAETLSFLRKGIDWLS